MKLGKRTYTVFGVDESDMEQRLFIHVDASSVGEAEKKALSEHAITIAGIVDGKIYPAKEGVPGITKIHARGYKTLVADVRVRYRSLRLPLRCPSCKANFKGKNTLEQWNLRPLVTSGRLPANAIDSQGEKGVKLGVDTTAIDVAGILGTGIRCTKCHHVLWEGVHAEEG